MFLNAFNQRIGNRLAGGIGGVDNTTVAMAAFLGQVVGLVACLVGIACSRIKSRDL